MLHPQPHLESPGAPIVEFEGVTAGYERRSAVEGVTFSIGAGDFVGLVGPSGSGKTTLLRAILGDVRVFAGEVRVRGQSPRRGRARVGYVPQLETVDWNFPVTVEQAVLMGCTSAGSWLPWTPRREREHAFEIMSRLGIASLAGRHIRRLSGGQQQRVFLARALVREPELLLLDEPTNGVDIKTRDDVLHLLDDLNHQGISILMTTHELNAVAAHLPWVICLNRRVVVEGPPSEVLTPEVLRETYGVEMPVIKHEGMTLVAERPHWLGRNGRGRGARHPAGLLEDGPTGDEHPHA